MNHSAPVGSTLYYSLLFSPSEQRTAIIALYAFYQDISKILDSCSDEQVAQTKLQWWKSEIIRTYEGQPRHPLTQALWPIIKTFQLPIEVLNSLIDHPNIEHITKLLALYIPGGNQEALAPYTQNISQSMQTIDNIIHIRKFEASLSTELLDSLKKQAQQARDYYKTALETLPLGLRHSQLNQIIFAELQLKLLTELEKDNFQTVLTHKTSLTPLRKLWIAWRVMRREKKFRLY